MLFVIFAAATATHSPQPNFKFYECMNDSKFHVSTNLCACVWADANEKKTNDNEECQNYNSNLKLFSIVWSTYCVSCSFARSLAHSVCLVCFLVDIYHVNIKLHQSTHCRISMFLRRHGHYAIAMHIFFRSMSIKTEMWFSIYRFSMCGQSEKKVFFIEKFWLYFCDCVCVSPSKVCPIGSLTSSIQSTFCFVWFDYFSDWMTDWLTESFIRATFYFLHRHRHHSRQWRHTSTQKGQ